MIRRGDEEHKLLIIWATACAEHVLPLFEKNRPGDDRPHKAIEAAYSWVSGELKISQLRKIAFAAHAAAQDATTPEAVAAARSAGHAAATAHVPDHAKHAASYAVKASANKQIERAWQIQKLPDVLMTMIQF